DELTPICCLRWSTISPAPRSMQLRLVHRFYVCTNLSCMLRGAGEIVDHLKQQIGVSSSEQVSPDGLFSFEEVECLGACEYAPMMRLDHRFHYDLSPEKIDTLIADRKRL